MDHALHSVVFGAALAFSAVASGQDEIAELTKPVSTLSIGAGYWTDDRPRLGIYDGMDKEGAYGLVDAHVVRRDDAAGTWFTLDARNLWLDTRSVRLDWLRQGDIGAFVEYDRIVRDNPYTFLTGVQGIGTSTLRVPTPSATSLGEVHLGTVREIAGAGFFKDFGGGYGLRVTFRNEEKDGTRQWGRGGAPEFAVEPIDSTTRQLDAVVSRTGARFQVQGGYYGSWYTNAINLVDTALTTGAGRFFLSQPLDNQAHQFFVNGGYNFTPSTRGTFKLAYTRATQDELIPVGPGQAVFAGAPESLDGRIDTTLAQVGLTSRWGEAFSWLASLRYYDSDEKTPQRRIIQTNPACPTTTSCVDNTPLSFETLAGKLEATYRMMLGLSVTAGLEQVNQDRGVPVGTPTAAGDIQRWVPWRAELDETIWRVALRRSLAETLNGSIAYLHAKRDGPEFTVAAANGVDAIYNNMINPIHIADRERDKLRLMLDWAALESLTLTFTAEYAKDEYGHSDARPFGLREGEATLFSLDAAYALSENWQFSAWYTRDHTEAQQFGRRTGAGAADALKEANLEDTGDTFGIGLRGALWSRLRVGGDVLYSKNVNKYPETLTLLTAGTLYPAGAVGPLPDITNEMTRLKLFVSYALRKNAELRLDYMHDRWKTDDWSWYFASGSPFTYGATTDGTTVIDPRKQTADFLGARYIYRFQ